LKVRLTKIGSLAAVTAAVAAGAPAAGAAAPWGLTSVGDFRQPVHAAGPSVQPRSLYVLERSGRVWRVGPSGRRRVFLDARRFVQLLAPRRHRSDQGGAFALAFGPRYRPGGRVYMSYTREDGRVHVDQFRPGPGGRPGDPRTLLSVRRTSRLDVGGDIAFGPDGMLYASFGFGRDRFSSQDPAELNGKIVRLDPRDRTAPPELFASGLRVPWRFSFDPPSARLIVADVGESSFEEINVLPLRADAPANLGWPYFEGRSMKLSGGPAGITAPALALRHGPAMCAIVGGFVVRTPTLAQLRGRYLYGDVCSGRLRSVRLAGRRAVDDRSEHMVVPYLVSFGRDGGGRLYAISVNGRVYRAG
jgi:glucose/arabinose dehydrogenase